MNILAQLFVQHSFPCRLIISIFVISLILCCWRLSEFPDDVNPVTKEKGGPRGPEPTRYGDWERKGRCVDFWYITIEMRLNGCFWRKFTDFHILGTLTQQFFLSLYFCSLTDVVLSLCRCSVTCQTDIVLDARSLNFCVHKMNIEINKRMDGSMYKFYVCIYFTVYYVSIKP